MIEDLRRGTPVLLAALCLTFAGCAATRPPPPSGFLDGYDNLAVDTRDTSLLWWERQDFDWRRYRGVILEPVAVRFHSAAAHEAVSQKDLDELSGMFRKSVVERLGDKYLTETPAADVLRVRAAITEVIPVRPALNVISNLAVMVNADVGGAAIEVEFLDSVTAERLAAGVDRKLGHRIDGLTGLTRFGQARRAFRDWAKELRTALETNP